MYREGMKLQRRVNIMAQEEERAKGRCVWMLFDEMENIEKMQKELDVEKTKVKSLAEALMRMSAKYDQGRPIVRQSSRLHQNRE